MSSGRRFSCRTSAPDQAESGSTARHSSILRWQRRGESRVQATSLCSSETQEVLRTSTRWRPVHGHSAPRRQNRAPARTVAASWHSGVNASVSSPCSRHPWPASRQSTARRTAASRGRAPPGPRKRHARPDRPTPGPVLHNPSHPKRSSMDLHYRIAW